MSETAANNANVEVVSPDQVGLIAVTLTRNNLQTEKYHSRTDLILKCHVWRCNHLRH